MVKLCAGCGKELRQSQRHGKYCSLGCQHISQFNDKIEVWVSGGRMPSANPGGPLRRWLLKMQDNRCSICAMLNEWNGRPILFILDHIDGNSNNDSFNNIRLVCPNCDSQLPTFKGRNKHSGRHYRRERYKQGKSY